MKKYFLVMVLFSLFSCDVDSVSDCIRNKGSVEVRHLDIHNLESITIRENIRLEIEYSEEDELLAEGGENHLDLLEVTQNGTEYEFKAPDLCKTGFSEAPITLKLKSSKLNYIRNSSQFEVLSNNILKYEKLTLISEDFFDSEALTVGNFKIEVDNSQINITGSGISDFILSGKTELLNFGTYSGSGTVLARGLEANVVTFVHRSFRDAVVTPLQRLKGEIRSSGNVVSTKKPPQVEVNELYTGSLIFE